MTHTNFRLRIAPESFENVSIYFIYYPFLQLSERKEHLLVCGMFAILMANNIMTVMQLHELNNPNTSIIQVYCYYTWDVIISILTDYIPIVNYVHYISSRTVWLSNYTKYYFPTASWICHWREDVSTKYLAARLLFPSKQTWSSRYDTNGTEKQEEHNNRAMPVCIHLNSLIHYYEYIQSSYYNWK
jgi:hypothetical protein